MENSKANAAPNHLTGPAAASEAARTSSWHRGGGWDSDHLPSPRPRANRLRYAPALDTGFVSQFGQSSEEIFSGTGLFEGEEQLDINPRPLLIKCWRSGSEPGPSNRSRSNDFRTAQVHRRSLFQMPGIDRRFHRFFLFIFSSLQLTSLPSRSTRELQQPPLAADSTNRLPRPRTAGAKYRHWPPPSAPDPRMRAARRTGAWSISPAQWPPGARPPKQAPRRGPGLGRGLSRAATGRTVVGGSSGKGAGRTPADGGSTGR